MCCTTIYTYHDTENIIGIITIIFISAIITYLPLSGPDLQTKGQMDHYVCVVETDLATQHWSGKSEGYAQHSQHAEYTYTDARGLGSMPPRRRLKITCSEIEYEGILKNIQCIYDWIWENMHSSHIQCLNVSTFVTHIIYLQ